MSVPQKEYARWLSPEAWASSDPKERALLVAAYYCDEVKVRETKVNRGFWVSKFLQSVGLGPGFAWCAAFVSFCLREGGYTDGPKTGRAAVRSWMKWAADNDRFVTWPERGDLVCLVGPGISHIEMVVKPLDSAISTIGGNTSSGESGSQDDGDGVYRRRRSHSKNMYFIRL